MQTSKDEDRGLPDQNFAIVSLQRRVFARSNIGFLFVNKQSINYHPQKDTSKPVYTNYNRNIGLEYNLASSNNLFTGKAFFLKSFTPGKYSRDFVQAAHVQYNSRHWNVILQEEYVGKNYNAEVGYVPRTCFLKVEPTVGRLYFPKDGKILSHGPKLSATYFFDERLKTTDYLNLLIYSFNFRKLSTFSLALFDEYVQLLQPFDPTNFGKDTLGRGTKHNWKGWRIDFISKPQSVFTWSFNTRYGGYYANGKRFNLTGEVGYRFQPYVSILASAGYNDIRLPQPWNKTTFWLVGSQVDITMTNKLFFSTFFQYNEQLNNINLNARFQWRYKPASDLFIVYTDNYLPSPFLVRNRAVVLKFTYWWNR